MREQGIPFQVPPLLLLPNTPPPLSKNTTFLAPSPFFFFFFFFLNLFLFTYFAIFFFFYDSSTEFFLSLQQRHASKQGYVGQLFLLVHYASKNHPQTISNTNIKQPQLQKHNINLGKKLWF